MDQRLIPLNGVVALLARTGAGWPSTLREQGYVRHLFEALVVTPEGDFRADAIAYRRDPDLVLPLECKSGANLEDEQARRYDAADYAGLRRTGALPAELRGQPCPVQAVFVGLEEHRPRLEKGLGELGITAPLLTVSSTRVRLTGGGGVPGLDDFDLAHQGGLPPARFPVDHQSPDEDIRELVVQQLILAQAQNLEFVGVDALSAAILPEWPLLVDAAQNMFIRRVEEVLRGLIAGNLRGDFRYEPRTGTAQGRVVVLQSPARLDPRGRTRAWQARETRFSEALERERTEPKQQDLFSIDQLAEQGGLADG